MSGKNTSAREDPAITLMNEIATNSQLVLDNVSLPLPAKDVHIRQARLLGFRDSFIAFYQNMDGFKLAWHPKAITDPDVKGAVNILSLEKVLQNWDNVIFFQDSPEAMRYFYPFDFFADEACVGIFSGAYATESLYFYRFQGEPERLNLDCNSYFKLIQASRGFLYWQYVLRTLQTREENPVSRRFQKYMPVLFPEFSYKAFRDLYQRARLRNE